LYTEQFDAQVASVDFVGGKVGQYAGSFNKSSRLALYGTGPNAGGNIVSFSVWINTSQLKSEMVLIHYGSIFGSNIRSSKDFFTLTLDNGYPRIYTSVDRYMKSSEDINLADGNWHHVGVSMPRKSCLLAEVQLYVDGNFINTVGPAVDKHIFTTTSGRMSIGSFGYSSNGYDDAFPAMEPYVGLMDDLKVWSRPLTKSDLPSNEKKFRISDGVKCNRKGMKKKMIRAKMKRCKNLCIKDATCFGFELRRMPEGRGKPKCFLLQAMPTIGTARSRTKCAIME
jgi:hypothetical protein